MRKNIKCPICKKATSWEGNPNRPFCSERCSTADLGKWASEIYSLEGTEYESTEEKEEKYMGI